MKFAICQELFEDWDWERQCRFIAEVGYTGIEVAPFALASRIGEVSAERRQELKRQAEDQGLSIIGLHWLLAKTEGLHLTSVDPAVRRVTADYLIQLTEACADLGGELMVFGSPKQRDLAPGMTHEEGLDHAEEVFRAVLPTLAERKVRLCLEPLTPNETNFLNTCAQAQELIGRIDHPNFVLHQDVKAMRLAESQSIPELIAEYAGRVGHFHANDTNLLGPGMGETDFVPIFAALSRAKYSGWVSVEVFDYKPGCERIARESFDAMQRAWARAST
ncbi:MAG TPA: sugar phosphate isomerase/epimerase family protein [Planctomycetaceae bacterium]|jgi:sugar phosphate isomerase/epimerase|nr:sugar phosphate isomerase/epimerase family protein [Planctomycetaceae bacterium]